MTPDGTEPAFPERPTGRSQDDPIPPRSIDADGREKYGLDPRDRFAPFNQPKEAAPEEIALNTFKLEVPLQRKPIYTWCITALFILYFLAMFASQGFENSPHSDPVIMLFTQQTLFNWGAWSSDMIQYGQFWRLVVSTWVFVGYLHIIFGVLCMISTGKSVEKVFSGRMLIFFYLVTGVAGGIADFALASPPLSVGPFNAIFGLIGVLTGFMLRYRKSLDPKTVRSTIAQSIFWVVLWTVISLLAYKQVPVGMLGGFSSGIVLGLVFRPLLFTEKTPAREAVRTVAAMIAVVLAVVSVCSIDAFHKPEKGEKRRPWEKRGDSVRRSPAEAESLKVKRHTNEEYGFSIELPRECAVTSLDHGFRFTFPGYISASVVAITLGPYDGPRATLEKITQRVSEKEYARSPELIEKEFNVRIGDYEFAKAEIHLDASFASPETIETILVTDIGEMEYTFLIQRRAENGFAKALADRIVESFRITAKKRAPAQK